MLITVKTLLKFLIFFLLTLERLATEEETPVGNHRLPFYLRVNYAESIYVSVTSLEIRTLIGSFSVRKSSVPYSRTCHYFEKYQRLYIKSLAYLSRVAISLTNSN